MVFLGGLEVSKVIFVLSCGARSSLGRLLASLESVWGSSGGLSGRLGVATRGSQGRVGQAFDPKSRGIRNLVRFGRPEKWTLIVNLQYELDVAMCVFRGRGGKEDRAESCWRFSPHYKGGTALEYPLGLRMTVLGFFGRSWCA